MPVPDIGNAPPIVRLVRLAQPENAPSSMLVTPFPIETLVRLRQ